jgi:hypothetical protein
VPIMSGKQLHQEIIQFCLSARRKTRGDQSVYSPTDHNL